MGWNHQVVVVQDCIGDKQPVLLELSNEKNMVV